ncbi:hypothetical protein Patl1_11080 [Pistacia atlantica]|uniref:Uncharacterized protein n=1 Tax=Pistacia atlantica TaxID=434234 RepID=A0ACC1A7J9_9ROSI|nr:hypothetical protein Patl1_11080 [Pistacia atlantica]
MYLHADKQRLAIAVADIKRTTLYVFTSRELPHPKNISLKGEPDTYESPFPENFLFGTASSSYQFEGAFLTDGKGLSNWDNFTHQPEGRFGAVNKAGIDHYNKFINALLLKGIQPFATLTHYDIPQELDDRYGAWLSPEVHDSLEDKSAAERAQAFYMNWFLDPIVFQRYPSEMHKILGFNLPVFSKSGLEKLKNGLDFIGINQYSSFYVKDCIFTKCEPGPGNSKTEGFTLWTAQKNGIFIGEPVYGYRLAIYPQGLEKVVTYIRQKYNNIPMYITENGFGEKDIPLSSTEISINDVKRVEYMSSYLDALAAAVRKGADVRGYFAWSLVDNFEWKDGCTVRFGLHHVDYATLKRTKRLSAIWYKQFIAKHKAQKSIESVLTKQSNGNMEYMIIEMDSPNLITVCKSIALLVVLLLPPGLKSHSSLFPSNFLFGTASSSYQFEGAYLSEGKGLSNWDVFTHNPGIQPFVTLTHFDSPQHLEDTYGAWLSPKSQIGVDLTVSVKLQREQGGSIGIVLHAAWFEPISNSTADKLAAERSQSFFMNWFLDPITYGKYPVEMKTILGTILPEFSSKDKEKLRMGLDFIGINHYTSYYIRDCISSVCEPGWGATKTEGFCRRSNQRNGVPIGESTSLEWLNVYPPGMEKVINYVKERYNNIPMFITENGYGEINTPNSTTEEYLHDVKRVEYMTCYLDALLTAMRNGADVRGYFAWSLLDNFEWTKGYTVRFGLHHVDYATLKRTPKLSATWYKQVIEKNRIIKSQTPENIQEHLQC